MLSAAFTSVSFIKDRFYSLLAFQNRNWAKHLISSRKIRAGKEETIILSVPVAVSVNSDTAFQAPDGVMYHLLFHFSIAYSACSSVFIMQFKSLLVSSHYSSVSREVVMVGS